MGGGVRSRNRRAQGPAVAVIPAGIVGTVRTGSLGFQVSANGALAFVPANLTANDSSLWDATAPSCRSRSTGQLRKSTCAPDGRRIALSERQRRRNHRSCSRHPRGCRGRGRGHQLPIWTVDGTTPVLPPLQRAVLGDGQRQRQSSCGPEQRHKHVPRHGGARPGHVRRPVLPKRPAISLLSLSGRVRSEAAQCDVRLRGSPHLSPDNRWLRLSVERDRTAGGLRPTLSRARSRMAGIRGWRRSGAVGSRRSGNLVPRQPANHVGRVR